MRVFKIRAREGRSMAVIFCWRWSRERL